MPVVPPLPTGTLYSPQPRSHLDTNMAARRNLRSRGKIKEYEQSRTFNSNSILQCDRKRNACIVFTMIRF